MTAEPSIPTLRSKHRIPQWERPKFIEERGFTCAYCGRSGSPEFRDGRYPDPDGNHWHFDHIVPVGSRLPGVWERTNLALSCARCNELKAHLDLADLIPELEAIRAHIDVMIAHAAEWPA